MISPESIFAMIFDQPNNELSDWEHCNNRNKFVIGESCDEFRSANAPESIEEMNVHESEGNRETGTVKGGDHLQLRSSFFEIRR